MDLQQSIIHDTNVTSIVQQLKVKTTMESCVPLFRQNPSARVVLHKRPFSNRQTISTYKIEISYNFHFTH
ncbi:hypothetical protein Hanom_Chr04g00338981 [Helianthus anomalus]